MDGDTIFIKISSLDNLALEDLRDFMRCLKYMGMRDEDLEKLLKRHFEKIKKLQQNSNQS
jgi:cation transport regulator ChaC